jgi:hypothetical protein
VKAKTPKQPSPKQIEQARLRFYGTLMANLLHSIKNDGRVPEELREQARKRHEKWDEFFPYRPLNPITIAELEKKLG